ncbi:MAG: 50S ribosomal protein L4 [Candidatus Obscuribacterales bacterium]|nr:50S ribosomal protein L4 [Candidatus Obscuribacterales bacterium]
MTSVLIKDLKGKELGKKELAAEVFGIEPNMHLVHSALVRQLANARSGSANTKTRSEVRGGGRKPWRQKGTGRARAGSTRSPLWNGGGVIFGPKPRDYSITMPRKARQLALKSALAARGNDIVLVQNFDGLFKAAPKAGEEVTEQPKTKAMVETLAGLGIADKKVLLVLDYMVAGAAQVARAARNLPNVIVVDHSNLNIKDLAYCQALLTTEQVLAELETRFKSCGGASPCSKKEEAAKAEAAGTETGAAKAKKTAKAAEKAVDEAKAKAAPAAEKKASTKKAAPEAAEDAPKAPKKTTKKKSEDA